MRNIHLPLVRVSHWLQCLGKKHILMVTSMSTLVCPVVSSGLCAMLVRNILGSMSATTPGARPKRKKITPGKPTVCAMVTIVQCTSMALMCVMAQLIIKPFSTPRTMSQTYAGAVIGVCLRLPSLRNCATNANGTGQP